MILDVEDQTEKESEAGTPISWGFLSRTQFTCACFSSRFQDRTRADALLFFLVNRGQACNVLRGATSLCGKQRLDAGSR